MIPVSFSEIVQSDEYKAINRYYGNRKTKRSQVPFMNHIQEGIDILLSLPDIDLVTIKAYCIHPIIQANKKLAFKPETEVLHLAELYRDTANAYLCKPETDDWKLNKIKQEIGYPLRFDLRNMLYADKMQNFRDFSKYHMLTHPRSGQLILYFSNWLTLLRLNRYH